MAALTGVTGTVVTIRSRPVILMRRRIDPVASTRVALARQQSNVRVR